MGSRRAHDELDVDLVVLALDPSAYVNDDSWVESVVGELAPLVRTMTWGTVTERRVRLASGLEVEFGFAPLSWAIDSAARPRLGPGGLGRLSGGDRPGLRGRRIS